MVGFQFPSADEVGDPFLVSRFANESANVKLRGAHQSDYTFAELDIWLGEEKGADSDGCLCLGTFMFESADHDYIIVVPCNCQYWWSELGFKPTIVTQTPQAIA